MCTYHQRVNERVDENKLPDRCSHVTHASPHAQHGSSMVISLESRAKLALGEDDKSIENLVELAEIKDPTIISQTLVPHAARNCSTGESVDNWGVLGIRDK